MYRASPLFTSSHGSSSSSSGGSPRHLPLQGDGHHAVLCCQATVHHRGPRPSWTLCALATVVTHSGASGVPAVGDGRHNWRQRPHPEPCIIVVSAINGSCGKGWKAHHEGWFKFHLECQAWHGDRGQRCAGRQGQVERLQASQAVTGLHCRHGGRQGHGSCTDDPWSRLHVDDKGQAGCVKSVLACFQKVACAVAVAIAGSGCE
jgi:hypothetical protein